MADLYDKLVKKIFKHFGATPEKMSTTEFKNVADKFYDSYSLQTERINE